MPNGEASRSHADGSGLTAPDREGNPADWGFEKTRGGMARETKIGLTLILVVGCAFGFVVWRKMEAQKTKGLYPDVAVEESDDGAEPKAGDAEEGAATASTVTIAATNADGSSDPFAEPTNAPKPRRRSPPPTTNSEPTGLFDPPPATTAAGRPASAPPQDNPFDTPEPPRPLARRAGRPTPQPLEPIDSGTDDMEPADAGTVDMADAAGGQGEPAEDFDDPFAPRGAGSPTAAVPQPSEPLDDGDFVPPVESDALVAGHETDAMPLEPSDPPASVRPRAAAPRGRPAPLGQPRDDGFGFEDLPRPKPRPSAPPVESDPFSGAPPATVASPAPRAAVAPRGGIPPASPRPTAVPMAIVGGVPGRNDPRPTVYEVQPNDNFWRISSKQYGTAKYYMALARVNVDRIPDPTKLRPGMKVLTPTPETLEARFPDLFPNRAAAAVAEGQAGFHYGPDGRPMYRIGESDTLGTIARDHLGRTSRWIQIYEMNRDRVKSPQELQVGAVLKLPLDASAVRVVQNPPMIR